VLGLFSNNGRDQAGNDSIRDLVLLSFHIKNPEDLSRFIIDNKAALSQCDSKGNNVFHVAALFGSHELFVRLISEDDLRHLLMHKNSDDKLPGRYWSDSFKKSLCGLPSNEVLSVYMEAFIDHSNSYFDFRDASFSSCFFKCLLSAQDTVAVQKAHNLSILDHCDFDECTMSDEVSSYLGSLGFQL